MPGFGASTVLSPFRSFVNFISVSFVFTPSSSSSQLQTEGSFYHTILASLGVTHIHLLAIPMAVAFPHVR